MFGRDFWVAWHAGGRDLRLIQRHFRFGVEGFSTIEGLPVNLEELSVQIPLIPAQIETLPVLFQRFFPLCTDFRFSWRNFWFRSCELVCSTSRLAKTYR